MRGARWAGQGHPARVLLLDFVFYSGWTGEGRRVQTGERQAPSHVLEASLRLQERVNHRGTSSMPRALSR